MAKAKPQRFTGTATPSGTSGRWNVTVPLPSGEVFTNGRGLPEAGTMAQATVANALGVDMDTVTVELHISTGVDALVAEAAAAVARRAEATRQADAAMRTAARNLLGAGITMRDAGAILGVSHQRIGQLVA